jgi:hypothetical protein
LEAKTAAIQEEFNRILAEKGPVKSHTMSEVDVGMDDFYATMGNFYHSDLKKHTSPTRRLMQMKESTWKHKQHFQDTLRRTQDYSLTYCTSPDKAYVIEPQGGELNYDEAYEKPNAFYKKVMEQDIMEHKVRGSKVVMAENSRKQAEARRNKSPSPRKSKVPLQTYSKLTKRKIGRILSAVHSAITRLVKK